MDSKTDIENQAQILTLPYNWRSSHKLLHTLKQIRDQPSRFFVVQSSILSFNFMNCINYVNFLNCADFVNCVKCVNGVYRPSLSCIRSTTKHKMNTLVILCTEMTPLTFLILIECSSCVIHEPFQGQVYRRVSVVEHRSAEAEDPRFNFRWDFNSFPSFSNARNKTKSCSIFVSVVIKNFIFW